MLGQDHGQSQKVMHAIARPERCTLSYSSGKMGRARRSSGSAPRRAALTNPPGRGRARDEVSVFLDDHHRISADVVPLVLAGWKQGVDKVQYLATVIDANGTAGGKLQHVFTMLLTQVDNRQSLENTTNYLTSSCS